MENLEIPYSVLDAITRVDPVYLDCLQSMRNLEPDYFAALSKMPPPEQDILCDYLSLCEEMSERKLELLCHHLGILLKR